MRLLVLSVILICCSIIATKAQSTNQGVSATASKNPCSCKGCNCDGCVCVNFNQCLANKTLNLYGANMLDKRLKPADSPCGSYEKWCCQRAMIGVVKPPPPPNLKFDTCGSRNFEGLSPVPVIGLKNESLYGEFPWVVAILSLSTTNNIKRTQYECGGSLIHPQVVLTAAHCVIEKGNLTVRAGEWETQWDTETYPIQDRWVKEVVIHENYWGQALLNDIALLFLNSPMIVERHIAPICLPQQGENMDNQNCIANGWGKDKYGKAGIYQVILKKVELPIVPRDTCQERLRQTRLGEYFELHSSFICAGGVANEDMCQGDGGSPLVCPTKNNPKIYTQAGIVSWGIGCNEENPGVYVSVSQFRNWIDSKLDLHDIQI